MPTRLSKALRSLTGSPQQVVQKASRGSLGQYVLNAPPEYGQPRPAVGDVNGLISPERMRELVQKTPTPASCINATVDFSIGVEITVRSTNPAQKPNPDKVTYLQNLLNNPNPNDTRRHFLRQIMEDVATIGWAAVEIERDRAGNLANLYVLDAAKLYLDFDEHGRILGYDMMDASGFPIHGPDGTHAWSPNEIILFRLAPKTDSRYPSSRIQQIFPAAVVENLMLTFIGQRFTDTNIPYGVFDLGDLTPDEIKKAVTMWNAQARSNHRIMITGSKGGSKFFPFGYALKELEAKDLLNEVRGFQMGVLGVTMNELGQAQDINKSNGYNLSYTFKKRAVEPLLGEICDTLTKRVCVEELGWEDVGFGYSEIDSRDELLQAQIDDTYVKMGGATFNEVLNRRGLPSVPGGDEPMVFTGSAFVPVRALKQYADAQLKILQIASQPQPAAGAGGAGGQTGSASVKMTPPKPVGPLPAAERFPQDETHGKSSPRVEVKTANQNGGKGPQQSQARGKVDTAKRAGVRND
jgi:hypothetical protein